MKEILKDQQILLYIYNQRIFPNGIPEDIMRLREKLINEEVQELFDAIWDMEEMQSAKALLVDKAHFLKEFSDVLVVLFGTAAQLGITAEEIQEAYSIVHIDNLSKAYSNEEDAQRAADYYALRNNNNYAVHTVTALGRTYYIVTNPAGKVMKRYPQPEEGVESRIHSHLQEMNQ